MHIGTQYAPCLGFVQLPDALYLGLHFPDTARGFLLSLGLAARSLFHYHLPSSTPLCWILKHDLLILNARSIDLCWVGCVSEVGLHILRNEGRGGWDLFILITV